ncbi:MAG: alpha/beta hydrolase family protein [Nitrospiria bacterium]
MKRVIECAVNKDEAIPMVLAEANPPSDRIVLLCHGFMSSKASSTNLLLTKRLLAEGIATARFDFYGHGDDKRPFQDLTLTRCLQQTDVVLSKIVALGYRKIGLLGSSYGGLVAILTAAGHPEIGALALKCPVSDYPPIWRTLLGEAGMAAWRSDGVLTFATPEGRARLGYPFYEDLLKYDAYQGAQSIQVPTLIIHGDADMDVPFEQSERLFETLSSEKVFEPIKDADHTFTKEADFNRMTDLIFNWFIQYLNSSS